MPTLEQNRAEAVAEALLPLLTLAMGQHQELYEIVGRDATPAPGTYLLRTRHGVSRVLTGDEILGYGKGQLAAAGKHSLIPNRVVGPPEMLTVAEAAEEFTIGGTNRRTDESHLSTDGVISRIHRGTLEVLYLPRRERVLFKDEIHALRHGGTEEDMDAWRAVRQRFGLPTRIKITASELPAGDTPYPLTGDKPYIVNCLRGMLIGDAEGWFRYLEPGDPEPHSRTLPLHIQEIGGQPMDVPSDYALHWLLGVADFYGPEHARLIAYRDGLV